MADLFLSLFDQSKRRFWGMLPALLLVMGGSGSNLCMFDTSITVSDGLSTELFLKQAKA